MNRPVVELFRSRLVHSRKLKLPFERNHLFASVKSGDFIPVARGSYLPAETWNELDPRERYLARIVAISDLAGERAVFSHASAAALWQLPVIDPWPRQVHVLTDRAEGGRSNLQVARHCVSEPFEIEGFEGLAVSTIARTVIDLARTSGLHAAVAIADAALRRAKHPPAVDSGVPPSFATDTALRTELSRVPLRLGSARARWAIEFADANADRPGESVSRVSMFQAGLPAPRLQEVLRGASGRQWIVDFWWPAFNLIGEFDGKAKYTDPEFLAGRTPAEAVYDEKLREDDLRAAGHRMSRWPWAVGMSPQRLGAQLTAAGIHSTARRVV